jgi:S-(hydroxymethyl)glutathione dehydrogenase/alcohol dehydrogenase
MKAAVLQAIRQPIEISDVVVDKPKSREVLVRVAASGLCHSDLHCISGDLPYELPLVLGHEAAGIVEMVGSGVTTVVVGDHVVACVTAGCGHCGICTSGRSNLCKDRPKRTGSDGARLRLGDKPLQQMGQLGAFAEQILVHESNLVRVDSSLPLDRAALLGCSVLTGLGAVFNAAKVSPGSKVAVIGCGGVGLNVIQGARVAGAGQIVAVDLVEQKRTLAKKFGATDAVAGGAGAIDAVRELTHGGVDFSFEVIGLPQTIDQAVRMLVPGGLMTLVGLTRLDVSLALPGVGILMNEWRIQGSLMGSGPFLRDIPRYASLYMKGMIDLDALISERIVLADINRGFETMTSALSARSVITFPEVLGERRVSA